MDIFYNLKILIILLISHLNNADLSPTPNEGSYALWQCMNAAIILEQKNPKNLSNSKQKLSYPYPHPQTSLFLHEDVCDGEASLVPSCTWQGLALPVLCSATLCTTSIAVAARALIPIAFAQTAFPLPPYYLHQHLAGNWKCNVLLLLLLKGTLRGRLCSFYVLSGAVLLSYILHIVRQNGPCFLFNLSLLAPLAVSNAQGFWTWF